MSELASQTSWVGVCHINELVPDVGVCALVHDRQIAVFKISGSEDVYALDAIDPFSKAPVLSRRSVGEVGGQLCVASPIFKQHFRLNDGDCIEDGNVRVAVYGVSIDDGIVSISFEQQVSR